MATMKQRLHRKNTSNTFDVVHLESDSTLILRSPGETVENSLIALPKKRSINGDPTEMFSIGEIQISPDGTIFIGRNNGIDVYNPKILNIWKKYTSIESLLYNWGRYSISYDYTEDNKYGNNFFAAGTYYVQHGNMSIVTDGSGSYYKWSEEPEVSYSPSQWDYGDSITSYTSRPTSYYILGSMGSGVSGGRYWYSTRYTITGTTKSIGSHIDDVSSQNRNTYPDNAISGNNWYVYIGSETVYSIGNFIAEIFGIQPTDYPTNGRHTDGYWYVKQ